MKLPYGVPYNVSPLIRGARYVMLVAGIFYGLSKQRIYEGQEAVWRIEEAKRKVIRDQEHARVKARIQREEREAVRLLESGKLFDMEPSDLPPPNKKAPPKKSAKSAAEEDDLCDE